MITRAIKWYKKISFWNKIRGFLATIGIGGEITLYIVDIYSGWKIVAALATLIGIAVSYIFEDVNKNEISDIFEKDK